MPPGFTVESHQLHFSMERRELATSVSSNRLEVTEDEAHRFLVLHYLQDQRTATRPVEIIRELLAPKLATLISEALLGSIVELAIDRDGRVTDLRSGSSASVHDSDWMEVLRTARFYPALAKGMPVASTGTFALSEFVR